MYHFLCQINSGNDKKNVYKMLLFINGQKNYC